MDATHQGRPPSAGAAATTNLERIESQVRKMRRELRRMVLILDAVRESWLLPTVAEIRAQRRALAKAEAEPPEPCPVEPVASEQASAGEEETGTVAQALAEAHEAGRAAAAAGDTATQCPFGRRDRGLRRAWLAGLRAASVE